MNELQRNVINAMTYEEMLAHRRFAPHGNEMFVGKMGDYCKKVMKAKGDKLTNAEKVRISKDVGWG